MILQDLYLTCFNNISSMRIQQDKLSSAFVVNSMCLCVGTISSESGVDFPEFPSFSIMGPKHYKIILKITQQIYGSK